MTADPNPAASPGALSIERLGCHLSYIVRGSGPPVVLVQGVGLHGDGWRPQVEGLAPEYSCLTFDNRGMGRSQPVGVQPTVEVMAEDTLAIMDQLDWRSAHVVGHSLGGLVALHLALSARSRVRSLSLLCTFARGANATRPTPWMIWVGLRTRLGTRRQRRRAFLQMVVPPDVLASTDREALADDLAPLFGHDLGDHPPIVSKQLAALRAYDATDRLGELDGLPTLVVSAKHDRIATIESGRALARGIPGAVYHEISDASHGVTIQQADRVNRLLRDHFPAVEKETG